MKRTIQFPIKGTFYYSASMALDLSLLKPDETLCFQLEPDNEFDKNAIQIWLPKSVQACFENQTDTLITHGLLLGYVPRTLAPKLRFYIKQNQVIELKVRHYASLGKQIEIDCQVTIDQAWLAYLSLFIQAKIVSHLHRLKRFTQRLTVKHH
ncbi:MAG TPA: hypothetical protein ENK73_05490 [Thiomicrospira sp.]|jgi:hypothetical protein|nr:hypothetical protein [Thiomicrospira sp.]